MRNTSWILAIVCALAAVACSGCGPLYATRPESQPTGRHYYTAQSTYVGFEPRVIRTVDAGATIAERMTHQRVRIDAQPASKEFVMQSPCEVRAGLDTYHLPAGVLKHPIVIPGSPRLLLAPTDATYPDHRYVAVRPDGTITDRIWFGNGDSGLEAGHVTRDLLWHIKLTPADCHYEVRDVPPKPMHEEMNTTVDYSLVYLGRDTSGLLKFGRQSNGILTYGPEVPAEPGVYDVNGLPIRVVRVHRYKLTYEVESDVGD